MANYHVMKDKNSREWYAKREKSERVSGYYNTQADAEEAAKEFASKSGGGEVRIHSPRGPIRDSDTIPPGSDSCPPRDKKH